MSDREAMKLALEGLEHGGLLKKQQAITALRACLAAPEPEPAAWQERHFYTGAREWTDWYNCQPRTAHQLLEKQPLCSVVRYQWRPLYTAPLASSPSEDIEALRRNAERYWWLRDKAPPEIGDMASVRDSHDPSEIDAAIDAAMKEDKT